MKTFNFLITFLLLSSLFYSCTPKTGEGTPNETLSIQSDEEVITNLFETIDTAILAKLINLNTIAKISDEELAITFLVIKDNKSGKITLANFKTENIFPLPSSLFAKRSSGGGYNVTCSGGSGGDWSASCSGKFSCGSKIAKCLEEGGCASICKEEEQMKYNAEEFLGIGDIFEEKEGRDFNELLTLENMSAVKISFTN